MKCTHKTGEESTRLEGRQRASDDIGDEKEDDREEKDVSFVVWCVAA